MPHGKKIDHRNRFSRGSVSWVEKIMEELPEQQKLVLQLRDVEEYDFKEIADLLEMQPTAVRVALSRARKTVREGPDVKKHYRRNCPLKRTDSSCLWVQLQRPISAQTSSKRTLDKTLEE